jgi:hypothetical protein
MRCESGGERGNARCAFLLQGVKPSLRFALCFVRSRQFMRQVVEVALRFLCEGVRNVAVPQGIVQCSLVVSMVLCRGGQPAFSVAQ